MGETTRDGGVEFDDLRARFRAAIEVRGLSVAEAAKRAGIAYSTLAAFLTGKYTGDNARVAQQAELWLRTLEEETIARAALPVLPTFVPTPSAAAFLDVLGHAQYVPDLVVITGGAGVGKTSACLEYQRTHPNVWLLTGEPSCASSHAMLEYLCEIIGINENAPSRRSRAIVRRVTGSNGLIIVDEAQHLTSQALDQLRTLHDKGGIGLALVGNEEVYTRLDGGARKAQFAQLFSRVGMRIQRVRPLARDVDALLDAAAIAGAAERKLLRAVAAKPGALRGMAKTLRVAHMLAAQDGGTIAERHLTDAWARLSDNAQIAEAVQ
jgi:DNA transposition AAA+ family ATPase